MKEIRMTTTEIDGKENRKIEKMNKANSTLIPCWWKYKRIQPLWEKSSCFQQCRVYTYSMTSVVSQEKVKKKFTKILAQKC